MHLDPITIATLFHPFQGNVRALEWGIGGDGSVSNL